MRHSHRLASILLLMVIGGYALWNWGHPSAPLRQNRPLALGAATGTEPTPGEPPSTLETLPPLVTRHGSLKPPTDVVTGPLDPYAVAHAWVEEDRGQPMGRGARVNVPPELEHYPERRRFLAIQMADAQEESYERPHDDGELAEMIRSGRLVELAPLTPDYILYDVGVDGADDPMMHYDVENNRDVPLFTSATELDRARQGLEGTATRASGRARAKAATRLELLHRYYDDAASRDALLREGAALGSLAADWGGMTYDLGNPQDKRRFVSRLLSTIRPEAREVLLGLAREYHQRFHRTLPVTSLIRTQRYQRRLGRVNANATHVEIPPHTTGLAFDVSYRYMAADEQQFLYDRIARLEDEGKVEALRERRNHVHVFVFADGHPPSESLVAQLLEEVRPSGAAAGEEGAKAEASAPRHRPRASVRASSTRTHKASRAAVRTRARARSAHAARGARGQ